MLFSDSIFTISTSTYFPQERKGPKLAGEKLLIRGIEEKYLSWTYNHQRVCIAESFIFPPLPFYTRSTTNKLLFYSFSYPVQFHFAFSLSLKLSALFKCWLGTCYLSICMRLTHQLAWARNPSARIQRSPTLVTSYTKGWPNERLRVTFSHPKIGVGRSRHSFNLGQWLVSWNCSEAILSNDSANFTLQAFWGSA